MEFTIVQGDIAEQSADVIVNAAGTSLRMGSGVAGALRRVAGDQLNEAAIAKGPIELGEVVVTDAFDIDAQYIIHAAAQPHFGDMRATADSIRMATRNTLNRADELGCESIVLPALGCGAGGVDLTEGFHVICEELHRYEPDTLEDIRVIAYSDEEYETMQTVKQSVIE